MACWYCKHDIGRFHNGDGCKYTLCDCKLDKADASAPPIGAAPAAAAPAAAAPAAAKRDEKSYQDMAIRSIADREKPREGEHPKEVLTSVEKEKPIDPTTTKVTKISEVDVNSPPPKATTVSNASPPNLEERAANLRDSKEEQIVEGSKEPSQEEIIEIKDKRTDAESPLSQGLDESYANFWREATKSWTDLYVEAARNVAEATEFWLGLFSKPWLPGGRTKDKSI
ncbi:MAG: hypothetical protein WBY22_02375 [Nitrososphaeraceae archaeon]